MTSQASTPDTVVFDLDGTLVDSVPDIAVALNRTLEEAGRRRVSDDEARLMVGDGARTLVARGFEATGGTISDDALDAAYTCFIAAYEAAPAAASRPFPGVVDCLVALESEGIALAVCTNKPGRLTGMVLEAFGIAPFFRSVIAGDTLALKKPAPEPLIEAVTRAGSVPERAVFVGDSPVDAATARAARVPFIAVSFGYTAVAPAELGAAALIDGFDGLPAALGALSRH